jgi:hypothetical protein
VASGEPHLGTTEMLAIRQPEYKDQTLLRSVISR